MCGRILSNWLDESADKEFRNVRRSHPSELRLNDFTLQRVDKVWMEHENLLNSTLAYFCLVTNKQTSPNFNFLSIEKPFRVTWINDKSNLFSSVVSWRKIKEMKMNLSSAFELPLRLSLVPLNKWQNILNNNGFTTNSSPQTFCISTDKDLERRKRMGSSETAKYPQGSHFTFS